MRNFAFPVLTVRDPREGAGARACFRSQDTTFFVLAFGAAASAHAYEPSARSVFNTNKKRMRKYVAIIIFLSVMSAVPLPVVAAAGRADSLHLAVDELFRRGVVTSLQVQVAALRERSAGESVQAARRAALPDLTVGIDAGAIGQPVVFERGLSQPTRPATPDWSQSYAVSLRQPLYDAGRIRRGVKRAGLQRLLAARTAEGDMADVKLTLLGAYLDLMRLYKQEEVLGENIAESERRLADIRRLHREGVVTNNDVLRSELRLREDSLALNEVRNALRLTSQELDVALGLDESTLIVPDTAFLARLPALPAAGGVEACIRAAYDANPSLLGLKTQTDIALTDLATARAAVLPTVSLVAGNTLARPVTRTMTDLFNNTWSVGLSLSVSLSALYKSRPDVSRARHDVALARNAEERQRQTLRMDVRRAWTRHQEAVERIGAMLLSIRQADENYRIMRNRYLNRLAILTDLLDAGTLRLDARLQYVTARTQAVYAYYELLRACGGL